MVSCKNLDFKKFFQQIEDESKGSSQPDWSSANGTVPSEWNNVTPEPTAPATPPRPLTPATDTHPRTTQTHGGWCCCLFDGLYCNLYHD